MPSDQISIKRKFAEGFLENIPFVITEEGGDVSRRHSPLSLFCILSSEDVMFGAVAANLAQ